MNRRLAVALYLGLWTTIAALAVYLLQPFWLGGALAFAAFFFVNATLAYIYRSRQLRLQGQQPPSFLAFLFWPTARGFKSDVAVPRPLRFIMGAVVFLGGALFAGLGALFLATVDFSTVAHPVGARVMLVVFSLLGLAFVYIGFRLLVMKNEERLFPRAP